MDTKRLDLNLLQTLEALLETRNVSRAADRLHLSQPAVSSQLARLRQLFDDPLLLPAHRGMVPTARAQALVEPLGAALDALRALVHETPPWDPARAELTVHIACTDYLQAVVLAPLAAFLARAAPGLRLAARDLDLAALAGQMAQGEVDLALLSPEVAPPGLRQRRLFEERYCLVARAGHPRLAGRGAVDLATYGELEHVVVSLQGGGFTTPVDERLAALGLRRRVKFSAASFLSLPALLAQTDLVALAPQRLAQGWQPALVAYPPPLALAPFEVALVWHEVSHRHPALVWLRQALVDLAASPDLSQTGREPRLRG